MTRLIFLSLILVSISEMLFSQSNSPKWLVDQTNKMVTTMEFELNLTKEQSTIVFEIVLAKRLKDIEVKKSILTDEEKTAKIKNNYTDLKSKLESKLSFELTELILKFMKDYNAKINPPKPAQ